MIHYSSDAWLPVIFRVHGTVWPQVWNKLLYISIYTYLAYKWCELHELNFGKMRSNILGATLSFLMVFRANNAYMQYRQGNRNLIVFFVALREIVAGSSCYMAGGRRNKAWRWRRRARSTSIELPPPDTLDAMVSQCRCNVIRWSLVVAISFQLHARVLSAWHANQIPYETKWLMDWDRFRLRHLMTESEFMELDRYIRLLTVSEELWDEAPMTDLSEHTPSFGEGPPFQRASLRRILTSCGWDDGGWVPADMTPNIRLPVATVSKLSAAIGACTNDPKCNDKPYGFTDRCLSCLTNKTTHLIQQFTAISQSIAAPLPFPYFHLVKVLLLIYFLSFPFFIEQELGFYANVCELCFLCFALLGVDAIATELENPFGDDANDLDVYDRIATLEKECMSLLELHGDSVCRENFVWQEMPQDIASRSSTSIPMFLALTEQVQSKGKSKSPFVHQAKMDERDVVYDTLVVEDSDTEGSGDDA